MKYKVGDKVRVKQFEQMEKEFGCDKSGCLDIVPDFTLDMHKFCGRVMTIESIAFECYTMKEDDFKWIWSDDMLEEVKG